MHMALVILAGCVLLGIFMLFGWLWGASLAALSLAAKAFLPVWLLVSLINMWVGVHHAGYTVREELPILFVVFLVPAAFAGLTAWRLARG